MPTEISLVKNGGFEDSVEGWSASGGVVLEHDAEHGDAYSGGCGKATFERAEAPGLIEQALAGSIVPSIASRGLSFQARVQSETPGAVFPWISEDGGTTKQYGYPNGIASGAGAPDADPTYETLTVAGYALTTEASAVSCGLEFRTSSTALIDNVTLVLGAAAVPYQDCVTPELLMALTGTGAAASRRSAKKPDYPASGREAGAAIPTATSRAPQTISPGGAPLLPRPGVSLPVPDDEEETAAEPVPAPAPASAPAGRSSAPSSRSSS